MLADSAVDPGLPSAPLGGQGGPTDAGVGGPVSHDLPPADGPAPALLTDVPKNLGTIDPHERFPWPIRTKRRDGGNPIVTLKPYKVDPKDCQSLSGHGAKGSRFKPVSLLRDDYTLRPVAATTELCL